MARVSGILRVNLEPLPSIELMSTEPRSFSMFFLTTSIPTPLPDISVTVCAVEKPGSKISAKTSLFDKESGDPFNIPLSCAFRKITSRGIPAPSSSTIINISFPSYLALKDTFPISFFPFAILTSGASTPWSIAFRKICTNGSAISSITFLSISVS